MRAVEPTATIYHTAVVGSACVSSGCSASSSVVHRRLRCAPPPNVLLLLLLLHLNQRFVGTSIFKPYPPPLHDRVRRPKFGPPVSSNVFSLVVHMFRDTVLVLLPFRYPPPQPPPPPVAVCQNRSCLLPWSPPRLSSPPPPTLSTAPAIVDHAPSFLPSPATSLPV